MSGVKYFMIYTAEMKDHFFSKVSMGKVVKCTLFLATLRWLGQNPSYWTKYIMMPFSEGASPKLNRRGNFLLFIEANSKLVCWQLRGRNWITEVVRAKFTGRYSHFWSLMEFLGMGIFVFLNLIYAFILFSLQKIIVKILWRRRVSIPVPLAC